MANIVASEIQSWVNDASAEGLSARSVVKYHTFLHAIFERAIIDQVIPINPCRHTVLPKLVKKPKTAITPEQFEALLAEIPDEFRLMVLVAIETGLRWGELAALRPIDIDFSRNVVLVQRVVLEVPKKISGAAHRARLPRLPQGQRAPRSHGRRRTVPRDSRTHAGRR